jgi:hypothetical protein
MAKLSAWVVSAEFLRMSAAVSLAALRWVRVHLALVASVDMHFCLLSAVAVATSIAVHTLWYVFPRSDSLAPTSSLAVPTFFVPVAFPPGVVLNLLRIGSVLGWCLQPTHLFFDSRSPMAVSQPTVIHVPVADISARSHGVSMTPFLVCSMSVLFGSLFRGFLPNLHLLVFQQVYQQQVRQLLAHSSALLQNYICHCPSAVVYLFVRMAVRHTHVYYHFVSRSAR